MATGSLWRQAQRDSKVPPAIAAAAASISSSPAPGSSEPSRAGPSSHQCCRAPAGRPKQRIPDKPSSRPNQPIGLMASPSSERAKSATSSGWESINTEPKPAPVRSSPSASRPWNRAPSTKANSSSHGQSRRSTCQGRCSSRAASSKITAAGRIRSQAKVSGEISCSSGFIAAIAVPQRAKGSSMASQVRRRVNGPAHRRRA